jgi:hypothetical protein
MENRLDNAFPVEEMEKRVIMIAGAGNASEGPGRVT